MNKNVLKSFYLNLRIKNKLYLMQLMIILVVCCISLAAIQIALNIYERILYQQSAQVLNLSTTSIDNQLDQVERFSSNIIANTEIQGNLIRLKSGLSPYQRSREQNSLTDNLWSITFERNITSVNIIDAMGNQYAGGATIHPRNTPSIITKAKRRKGAMVFIEPMAGDPSLICAREIRKIKNLSLEYLGILIIRVNMANLVQQSTGLVNRDVNLMIRSGKKIIYGSNPDLVKLGLALHFDSPTGYGVIQSYGKSYFEAHTRSDLTGWTYISILPYETVFRQIRSMRNIVLAVFGALFVVTVFISMKFARNLTEPIEALTARMKQVENGNFEPVKDHGFNPPRSDEIGQLQCDFDIMIQKINTLIREDYTKQIVIKESQIKALQAQINPHFLYNTLESINWLAKMNHQHDISQMAESLGNLLRNAISNRDQIFTIREELKLVQDYIAIQKIRFGERLEFELEADPDLLGYKIPKLCLQPIVENSINYGVEKMIETCRITVKITADSDCLRILIADNGPGIDSGITSELNLDELHPRGFGIGLKNINDRIKLIFGDEYGISVTSRLGQGTQVTLRFPKTEGPYV